MTEARPRGIGLALLVIFAAGTTGAAFLFLGYAALNLALVVFVPAELDEEYRTAGVYLVASISAIIGSAFAIVAAAAWWTVIGPRGHSHA